MLRFASPSRLLRVGPAIGMIAVVLLGAACKGSAPSNDAPSATPAVTPTSDEALMAKGLDQLSRLGDAAGAAETFRAVLKQNPTHYGARYQLATALDRSGAPAEARPVWDEVLRSAESIKDEPTAGTARTRLAKPDTLSQQAMMAVGLKLLNQNAPAAAARQFRAVLERNSTHYGAHYQLATALDRAGKPAEARPLWIKVLAMAEGFNDQPTVNAARARLQRNP